VAEAAWAEVAVVDALLCARMSLIDLRWVVLASVATSLIAPQI